MITQTIIGYTSKNERMKSIFIPEKVREAKDMKKVMSEYMKI